MGSSEVRLVLMVVLMCALGACAGKQQPQPEVVSYEPGACYAAIQQAKPLSACGEACKKNILDVCVGQTQANTTVAEAEPIDDDCASKAPTALYDSDFNLGQVPLGLNDSGGGEVSGPSSEWMQFFGEVLKLAIENAHHFIH